MSGAGQINIFYFSIIYCNKMWQELLILIYNRKIFLMLPHGGNQSFIGQLKKFFIKAATYTKGFFDQITNSINQSFINNNFCNVWIKSICNGLFNFT